MEVRLVVDDEEIELNRFVTEIIGRVLEAMISTLKGVRDDWKIAKVEVIR